MILKGLTWLVVLQLLGSVIHLSLLPALRLRLNVAALLGRRAVRAARPPQALAPLVAVCGRIPCKSSMNEAATTSQA